MARKSWVIAGPLIVALLVSLAGQLALTAAPQDAQVAPRSTPAQQPPAATGPAPVLRVTYPAGAILNNIVLDPRPETAAAAADAVPGGPTRVGVGRAIPSDLAAQVAPANLVWRPLGAGQVTAFTITSPGAAALRLAMTVTNLPPGAELRFFDSADPPKAFGPFSLDDVRSAQTDGDPGPAGLFWSPIVEGDTIGVEIFVPVTGREADVQFGIPYVSHLTVFPGTQRVSAEALGDAASCEVDVACNSAWATTALAVARISYVQGIDSFSCSGTLLADRTNTHTPYFLTANHCVSTSSSAATVNSFWFFQKTTCGGSTVSPVTQLTNGALLLVHAIDYSFLQLKEAAPAGATFAAWDPNPVSVGRSVVGIHHPQADAKKISTGIVNALVDFNFTGVGRAVYIDVDWSSGQTEPGSSGSGLFYSDSSGQYLVGTLTGSNTSCTFGTSKYIQFAVIYQTIGVWLEGTAFGSKAVMLAPVSGFQFGGATVTFEWSAGYHATAYWLDVGFVPGSGDVFGANVGLVTEQTVTNIPVKGETVYVRLWTQLGGVWQFNDYSYSAFSIAALTTPAGSVLCAPATFAWTAVSGAQTYWLDVGTVFGSGNIFGQNVGSATARTVPGIPSSGTVYVRLWTRLAGVWFVRDYSYTACGRAALISPASGSNLGGTSTTFTWTAGSGATAYQLDVGTAPGQGNLSSQNTGLSTSGIVTNLPSNNAVIYVRLSTLLAGTWQFNDYVYTAAGRALITNPTGPVLCGSPPPTLTWTPIFGALEYILDIGTSAGSGNIFSQSTGLDTFRTIPGIPTDGSVFVRVTTRLPEGLFFADYAYAAKDCAKAGMLVPAPGTTLSGPGVHFMWHAADGASAYWLDVGTQFGEGNIFGQRVGLETEQFVAGLPTDGRPVYVRLWTLIGNVWHVNDYSYSAPPALTKAELVSPAQGTTLPGNSVRLAWNAGAGATEYWLDVGSTPGQGDYFASNVGLATSLNVPRPGGAPLPTSASNAPVYVRLWTKLAGAWQFNDYAYTLASSSRTASLVYPVSGSILTGDAILFQWTIESGATHWLDVGTSQGSGDIYARNVGSVNGAVVSGLPTDGRVLYSRLWTNLNGWWSFNDYTLVAAPGRTKAVLRSPEPGSMFLQFAESLYWDAGSGAAAYWIDVGTIQGSGNLFAGNVGLVRGLNANNLPKDGKPIYVRLWTLLDGVWQVNDYTFFGKH